MLCKGHPVKDVLAYLVGLEKSEFEKLSSLDPGGFKKYSNADIELSSASSLAYS